MAGEWYYAKGDKQIGPVSASDLKALAHSGGLAPTDVVWKEGMDGWVPARQIKGLFPGGGAQTKKAAPPPLSVTGAGKSPVALAGASDDSPLPPPPWSAEERDAQNPKVWLGPAGIGGAVLLIFFAIAFNRSDAAGPAFLLGLAGAVLGTVFYVRDYLGLWLHGRWVPTDGGVGWVEFLKGGIVKREDGTVGTFVLLRNHRFIDTLVSGRLVDSWKILSMGIVTLEIQDTTGKTRSFKKGKTLDEQQVAKASFFHTDRIKYLHGSWQPIGEATEWMEFTRDGAVVFSDGSAGKYTVSGEEPNELIDLEMVGGASRRFRVVSLTPTQLVIAEGDEATTFRRPGKSARGAGSAAASTQADRSGGAPNPKGVLGGLFSFFTKWKCPKCGQRAGERTKTERISDVEQQVMTTTDRNSPNWQVRQVVVNVWRVRHDYACTSCSHRWEEEENKWSQA